MRVAKIITTCFVKRTYRRESSLVGDPLGYFGHSQLIFSSEDALDLLKFNIEKEKKIDPGVKNRDLIIINNNVNFNKGNNFLKKISGTKIPFGKIITCTRKNTGMSYGAYSYAFKKYKNFYDYFIFTEDDTIIFKKNYFKIGINLLKKTKNAGYVAYLHSTRIPKKYYQQLNLNHQNALSCHGATGLSSTKLLRKIELKHGKLPYHDGKDYEKCIIFGELAFPNAFVKMGYKIIDLPKNLVLTMPTCDLMRGRSYKKWPNNIDKINFYIKSSIYKIFSSTPLLLKIYLRCIKIFRMILKYD